MTWRSSHENVNVAWQCISERLWKCLVGRYGGCFEEHIMRLMMAERIMPRVWMHRRSMCQLSRWERAMQGTEEARKVWVGGIVNFRILTLVRRTHALIIGNSQSNQEVHKEKSTPRRSVWGFGYPCASSNHGTWVYSNIWPLQRLVIHLVARVLN